MRVFLIIAIFGISVVLMYRKKMNTVIGLPVMALLIGLVAGIPLQGLMSVVVSEGAVRLHQLIAVIIFGATLAEIVKRTGIVEVMIKNTAEFLGDNLILISIFLMLIIALLSTVLAGLGAVVMVGTIVFPIMISLGISKLLAASIFLIGLSLGGTLNLINWTMFIEVLKLSQAEIFHYVIRFLPAALVVAIGFIVIETKREGASSFKLQLPPKAERKKIPVLAFFTPLVPIFIVFASNLSLILLGEARGYDFPILAAMLVGIVYGVGTAPKSAGPKTRLLTRSIFEGITNVAPAIALMIGIGMLLKAVSHPDVKELLSPYISAVMPRTKLSYVLFFTIAAPLSLYRGPLNIFGMGSGLISLMKDTGFLGGPPIMAAIQAVGQLQGVSDPTNSYNVWIANYLGLDVVKIMKKTVAYMWVMTLVGLGIGAWMYF